MLKAVVIVFLIAILASLGSALLALVRVEDDKSADQARSNRLFKSLVWRISLSLILFIILLIAYGLGFITPPQPLI